MHQNIESIKVVTWICLSCKQLSKLNAIGSSSFSLLPGDTKEGIVAPGTLGCPKPGPLKCLCAPRHQILARCAAQKRNCDKAKCATKLRQLSAPKYAYLANYAYLGAPNMVSLKRSFKMQFRRVDLRSIGPPSQKL